MSRERRTKTRFGHLLLLSLMVAPIGACSLGEDGPEDVVRQAGDALVSRNRAAFYDLVDLKRVESQFIDQLRWRDPNPANALRLMTGTSNGELLGKLLAVTFASPPDTSMNGRATARALARQLVQADVTVQGTGKAQISGSTAFVPVFVRFGTETEASPVSVQLEKPESRWRIVAIHDLSGPVRNARREAARARGELYLDSDLERAAVAAMKSDLRNLVTVQEAYFADHQTYASTSAQLGYHATTGVTVTIGSASEKGWASSATSQQLPGATCWIFVGAPVPMPPQPPGSSSTPQEGAPYCATTS